MHPGFLRGGGVKYFLLPLHTNKEVFLTQFFTQLCTSQFHTTFTTRKSNEVIY